MSKNAAMLLILLGGSFMSYVFAMLLTSVASTLFLLTTAPFMAAIIGWLWIDEKPHPFTWAAMVAAVIGVGDDGALAHTHHNDITSNHQRHPQQRKA